MDAETTTERVFVGVDLAAGERAITYVALDARRRIIAQAEADLDGAVAALRAYPRVVCAVDAPQTRNAGLMADPQYRAQLGLRPGASTYSNYKVCEYELRRRGIGLYNTPRDADAAPKWMRFGWRFYAALQAAGMVTWPEPGARQVFEVHPHACFTVMLGHRPLKKVSLEGRLQRQALLYRAGVGVRDPMTVLEELTPHRLLMGDLSFDGLLLDHDTLDALAAAYTAWLTVERPEQITAVGDPNEGLIVLPTEELKDKYPRTGRQW
ncbi:MAG: hypothetical protein Kow00120_30140 [Anaerolineae bacterium]